MSDPRCLIVDPDRQSAETLAGIMGRHGFSTHLIAQAFDALRHLRKNRYDLILFDLSTPGGDGAFVLEQVKREMPDVTEYTIIVTNNPLAASDVTGGIAIIGRSDLKPMLQYLIPEKTR